MSITYDTKHQASSWVRDCATSIWIFCNWCATGARLRRLGCGLKFPAAPGQRIPSPWWPRLREIPGYDNRCRDQGPGPALTNGPTWQTSGEGSNYASCGKHTACGKYNRCRDQGATVLPLTNTVGRHDRHVGGRQAQAPRPPQPDSGELEWSWRRRWRRWTGGRTGGRTGDWPAGDRLLSYHIQKLSKQISFHNLAYPIIVSF